MFNNKVVDTYSKIHNPIRYTNDNLVSFDGSQIQSEFFRAWDSIQNYYSKHKPKKLSFLEIGAWKGLWGIAFSEFCNMNSIEGTYATITLIDDDAHNNSLYNTFAYLKSNNINTFLVNGDSTLDTSLSSLLEFSKKYNIVFIDGSHKYDSVMSDISKYSKLATDILIFHDIRPKNKNKDIGVYSAIIDSNIILDEEIVTKENLMGIGLKYVTSNTKP